MLSSRKKQILNILHKIPLIENKTFKKLFYEVLIKMLCFWVTSVLVQWDFFNGGSSIFFELFSPFHFFVCSSQKVIWGKLQLCAVIFNIWMAPLVNFINILRAAFAHADPKSAKDWQLDLLFCAFGICTHKMLMKLTPMAIGCHLTLIEKSYQDKHWQ